jgi:hypothetical protein
MNGKTKDNHEIRQDLRKMKLRPELHPFIVEWQNTFGRSLFHNKEKRED